MCFGTTVSLFELCPLFADLCLPSLDSLGPLETNSPSKYNVHTAPGHALPRHPSRSILGPLFLRNLDQMDGYSEPQVLAGRVNQCIIPSGSHHGVRGPPAG